MSHCEYWHEREPCRPRAALVCRLITAFCCVVPRAMAQEAPTLPPVSFFLRQGRLPYGMHRPSALSRSVGAPTMKATASPLTFYLHRLLTSSRLNIGGAPESPAAQVVRLGHFYCIGKGGHIRSKYSGLYFPRSQPF